MNSEELELLVSLLDKYIEDLKNDGAIYKDMDLNDKLETIIEKVELFTEIKNIVDRGDKMIKCDGCDHLKYHEEGYHTVLLSYCDKGHWENDIDAELYKLSLNDEEREIYNTKYDKCKDFVKTKW